MNATVLLLDADGVVQEGDPGFRASLEALCPEPAKVGEFVAGVFAAERPCATGERDFAEALGEVLNRWNSPGTLDEALSCWERVEPSGQVLDFLAELRGGRNGRRSRYQPAELPGPGPAGIARVRRSLRRVAHLM